MDIDNMYGIDNLDNYPITWDKLQPYVSQFKYNQCLKTDKDFEIFKRLGQNVIDVRVYFQLTKRINRVEELNVNFDYLHKLLTQKIMELNEAHPTFLDEATIDIGQLPFNHVEHVDNTTCVYPYVGFFPLHHYLMR
jgi:hypothetical protein